ncbi:hypothetical protein CVS40_11349 [Lucilia cuprina]|nr:hypothetical protein CVS40_11349 [Lucilia cuprina]
MTDALYAADIEFPSSATLSQLRGLYEALMTQQSNHALKPASKEDTAEDMNQCAVQANTDAAENTIKTHVVANPAAQQQTHALEQYAVEANTEVHVHDAAETEDNASAVPKPAKQLGNDRYEISDEENCQVTQLPYRGVVDSTRLKKWLEVKDSVKNKLSETEGNTSEYEDYEFLEDEFLQDLTQSIA